jgi:hypothetical protein
MSARSEDRGRFRLDPILRGTIPLTNGLRASRCWSGPPCVCLNLLLVDSAKGSLTSRMEEIDLAQMLIVFWPDSPGWAPERNGSGSLTEL